jgi:hypothetical protein
MAGLNVSLAEVFRASNAALRAGLHTSMPGVIKSYDPETKLAVVQPVLKTPVFDTDTGEAGEAEELPAIPNVPVSFPRGGGWHLSFPLAAGDHVTLVFSEAATGQWRTTGEVSEPADVRRHALGYPTAFLGAHPDADVLVDDVNPLYADALVIGKDGDPTQSIRIKGGFIEIGGLAPLPLAMAVHVLSAMAALQAEIDLIQTALTPLLLPEPPAQTNFTAAMVAAKVPYTAAIALVPATISKGQ